MASPPYSYTPTSLSPGPSPSYAGSSSKKRASEGGVGMAPSIKRRKPSTMSVGSATQHPLRQTSFPPDESQSSFYDNNAGARSPSIDSSMSLVSGSMAGGAGGGSQVSAAAATQQQPVKKKRGRKSKAEKAAMREREQTPSVAGGSTARTVVSGVSDARAGGRGRSRALAADAAAAADEEDENMELDRADVHVAATAQETTAEQKEEENRLKHMLVSSFSKDQFERYEAWRASGFSKGTVRKVRLTRRGTCLL